MGKKDINRRFSHKTGLTHADVYSPPESDNLNSPPRNFSREQFEKNLVKAKEANRRYRIALYSIRSAYA